MERFFHIELRSFFSITKVYNRFSLQGTPIKTCVHMKSEPANLGGVSLKFAVITPRRDKNFSYEHAQVGQPGKV